MGEKSYGWGEPKGKKSEEELAGSREMSRWEVAGYLPVPYLSICLSTYPSMFSPSTHKCMHLSFAASICLIFSILYI